MKASARAVAQPAQGYCRPAVPRTKQLASGGIILLHELGTVCRAFRGRTGQSRVAQPSQTQAACRDNTTPLRTVKGCVDLPTVALHDCSRVAALTEHCGSTVPGIEMESQSGVHRCGCPLHVVMAMKCGLA
eukprot:365325-Chlamydomonas_euryale.AAC.24